MNKRKLIKKLALPAGIIAAISIVVLIAIIPIENAQRSSHKDEFKKYIASFMEQNKSYIKGIAGKVKSLPVDPVIVNELQSNYMIDHQKSDEPKKYLWMSSTNGDFLFGVPSEDFQELNNTFDKYQTTIKADDFFNDRNDFLVKLIDRVDEIKDHHDNYWRYYRHPDDWGLIQPTSSSFSTPVYDEKEKLIAELYLKVDDKVNIEKYYTDKRSELLESLRILFITLLVFSGIFLWFLLPTWVYIDAQDRDVKNPGIWAFLTLTSLFFGLTIYLITRPNTLKSFNCPQCDGELNGTRAYCPHCGYDLSNTFCQQCQYPIKPEWQFCPNCRAETKQKEHKHIDANSANSNVINQEKF